MAEFVTTDSDGQHLRVVIDRAERANALTHDMVMMLTGVITAVGEDAGIRVVEIQGAGDRVFCGGFDLGQVGDGTTALEGLMDAVLRCPVPVLARINGDAIGAGFELAAMCDLRVARRGARIGFPAVRLGVPYRPAAILRIMAMGPTMHRLLLTGETAPVEAHPGFAEVVEAHDLASSVRELVDAIVGSAPLAMSYLARLTRTAYEHVGDPRVLAAFGQEREDILEAGDLREGVLARREGRAPRFAPRSVGG